MSSGIRDTRVGYDTSRVFGSFIEVVREVLIRPADFFSGLGGPTQSVKGPLLFAIICSYISLPLAVLAAPLNPLTPDNPFGPFSIGRLLDTAGSDPLAAAGLVALGLALVGLFAFLGAYIGTAFQHFFVWIFIRQRRGYWGTFPVYTYSAALALFTWIPVLGYVISLYIVYVHTVGLREMHETTTLRAFLAAAVPILLSISSTATSLYMASLNG